MTELSDKLGLYLPQCNQKWVDAIEMKYSSCKCWEKIIVMGLEYL